MKWTLFATGLALAAACAHAQTPDIPDYVAAAVGDPARAADSQIDDRRKVAALVAFTGAKPGDRVFELIPGSGYFTKVFSKVVGPEGTVYAVWPEEYRFRGGNLPEIASEYGNIEILEYPADQLSAPKPVDVVFTSQNYHDYPQLGTADVGDLNSAAYEVLKPGGVYVVVDHAAEKGSGMRDTSTLHRIDPNAVKQQVTAAGFEFVDKSEVLNNPADDHRLKVFNPEVRGHTDQFVYKFRKPMN